MNTVFRPGYPPAVTENFLALWPGLTGSGISGDLIQTVAATDTPSGMKASCGAVPGQWYAHDSENNDRINSN
jgi:hypothetical protein